MTFLGICGCLKQNIAKICLAAGLGKPTPDPEEKYKLKEKSGSKQRDGRREGPVPEPRRGPAPGSHSDSPPPRRAEGLFRVPSRGIGEQRERKWDFQRDTKRVWSLQTPTHSPRHKDPQTVTRPPGHLIHLIVYPPRTPCSGEGSTVSLSAAPLRIKSTSTLCLCSVPVTVCPRACSHRCLAVSAVCLRCV